MQTSTSEELQRQERQAYDAKIKEIVVSLENLLKNEFNVTNSLPHISYEDDVFKYTAGRVGSLLHRAHEAAAKASGNIPQLLQDGTLLNLQRPWEDQFDETPTLARVPMREYFQMLHLRFGVPAPEYSRK